jgi:hypothetical protein
MTDRDNYNYALSLQGSNLVVTQYESTMSPSNGAVIATGRLVLNAGELSVIGADRTPQDISDEHLTDVSEVVTYYLQRITDGNATELARFLLIDGGVTEQYVEIAERIIKFYTPYDTRRANIVSIVKTDGNSATIFYTVTVRDGRGDEFDVPAQYGDGLVSIDVSAWN